MNGSDFCEQIRALPRLPDREDAIYDAVARGDFVSWDWFEVQISGRKIIVASDYLAIGDVDDFVRMPCGGDTAERIVKPLGYRLPTQAEVDAIYAAADVKLVGEGMGAPWDASMMSIDRIVAHDKATEKARAGRLGLVAGHRKDILGVRPRKQTDRPGPFDPVLAFYGLFDAHGHPIQRDDGAHEPSYSDGTHGVRFVYDPSSP